MNRTNIKIFLAAFLGCIAFLDSLAHNGGMIQNDSAERIPIIENEPVDNHHRSLLVKVDAYYQGDIVYVIFNKKMGNALINIYNVNSGMAVNKLCDTGVGTVSIDISNMGEGVYYIEICTEDGSSFTGEFNIFN